MKTNVVYKGIATTTVNSEKTYIGITEGPWKHRHSVHKTSFKNRNYPTRTSIFFSIRIFSSRIELQRRGMAMKFSQSHAGSRNLQHITLKKS